MGILGIGYAVSHDLRVVVCLLASAILVSFGRRIVGGVLGDWTGWPPPHLLACIVWATAVGLAALLGGAPWWGCIVVGLGAWLGHVVTGLNDSAGLGHYGDRNELWTFWGFGRWTSAVDGKVHRKPGFFLSYLGLSLYGMQIAAAAIALTLCPLVHGTWWIVLIGGLSLAPVYSLTWLVFRRKPIGWAHGCEPPLALAEWQYWFLGACICAGMMH